VKPGLVSIERVWFRLGVDKTVCVFIMLFFRGGSTRSRVDNELQAHFLCKSYQKFGLERLKTERPKNSGSLQQKSSENNDP
jgi:hypothetical protein